MSYIPGNERHGDGEDAHGATTHEVLCCGHLLVLGEESEVDADEGGEQEHGPENGVVQPIKVTLFRAQRHLAHTSTVNEISFI